MPALTTGTQPGDHVLASGHALTVREFVPAAFERLGLRWKDHVRFDPRNLRPAEVDSLIGDPSKARRELGWQETVSARDLARLMVDADLEALKNEARPWVDVPRFTNGQE